MEKQQTALTELIEWINFIEHKYGGDGVSHIKTKATELLETEKQQMIDFTKFCLKTSADSDDEYFDNYFESKTHNP